MSTPEERRSELRRNRDERIARLPQWAQTYIGRLEQKVADAEAHIDLIAAEAPADANVFMSGRATRNDVALGRDLQIRFQMVDRSERVHQDFIDIRHGQDEVESGEHGCLVVHSDRPIYILPYATNSIRIVPR